MELNVAKRSIFTRAISHWIDFCS